MKKDESEETEVKKGLEWLKEEIEEDIKSWGGGNPDYFRGASDAYENVKDWLNQLDEPEVLSDKWIDDNSVYASSDGITEEYVHVDVLKEMLVPKQDLPVIPKFVAAVLEKNKRDNFILIDTYSILIERGFDMDRLVQDWLQEDWTREETFARAWLDGYTLEEEQKLTAGAVIEKHIELLKNQEEAVNLKPYYDLLERVKNE